MRKKGGGLKPLGPPTLDQPPAAGKYAVNYYRRISTPVLFGKRSDTAAVQTLVVERHSLGARG